MLTEATEKKIGIFGIGNLLLEDEGFGVHVINELEATYSFPDNVLVQDVGTAGIYMSPFLEECDPVYVVDVVDIKGEPGSYHHFTVDDVKSGKFSTRLSPHQLGMLEIMEICKLRDACPEQVEFFTIIPYSLGERMELSAVASEKKEQVIKLLLEKLASHGVKIEKKDC